jgi:hypothetical protein
MTKKEIGTAEMHQPADDIAWRHFWLANVVVETEGRLHHMRAVLGGPRH